jgi:predicted metal-binding membrane protein
VEATTRQRRADPRQVAVVAALLAASALAWLATSRRMAGMDAGPGTDPGTIGFYVSAWVAMMAAMMFPSLSPVVATYAEVERGKRGRDGRGGLGTAAFVGGYLLAWTAFGLLAYGVYELGRSLDLGALSWGSDGRYVAAAAVGLAAVYQLTPLKDRCLSKCRNPLGFVVSSWRDGPLGAVVMGMQHGGWCIGCCWALMAVLFAVGVMSVAWMLAVALLVAAEKLLPWERLANGAIAAVLVALAIGVGWAPSDVPGLTVPDSEAAGGMSMSR